MGIALHADGNLHGAVIAYSKAIHLRSAFWRRTPISRWSFMKRANSPKLSPNIARPSGLLPARPRSANNLGNTYCDQGEYEAAIVELKDLYRQHPEWQQGHGCLASAYMAKKNYEDAVSELQLALRQNPTGATEHRVLGRLCSSITGQKTRCVNFASPSRSIPIRTFPIISWAPSCSSSSNCSPPKRIP